MIDKHEGVTDWEAAARIAMARADREAEAKVIILDFIEEMRDTLTAILGACGRDRKPITENKCRKAIEGLSVSDDWDYLSSSNQENLAAAIRYDADPIPPSDADPGL